MFGLIHNELIKIRHSKKLYFALLLIPGFEIAALLQYLFASDKPVPGGVSFVFAIIDFLPYVLVLFISVFVAEQWTEESTSLKLSLTRPIGRAALLNAKLIAACILVTFFALYTVATAYAIRAVAFDWDEQVLWNGSVAAPSAEISLCVKAAMGVIIPALGFCFPITFIAILADNSGIAIGISLGIATLSQLLEQIEAIKEYSIVYHMRTLYQDILQNAEFVVIWNSLWIIAAYITLFYLLGCLHFRKKDITS